MSAGLMLLAMVSGFLSIGATASYADGRRKSDEAWAFVLLAVSLGAAYAAGRLA